MIRFPSSTRKFLVFLVFATAIALAATSHALLPPRPIDVNQAPSTVGIVFKDSLAHCTAVKVAPKVFLTAAHCFQGFTGYDISLEQVSKGRLVREQRTQVTKLEVHFFYGNPSKLKVALRTAIGDVPDLAMFKTAHDIDVPAAKVSLDDVQVGQKVLIGGYGEQGKDICHPILHPCSLNMAPQIISGIYHDLFFTKPTRENPYFLTHGDSGGPAYVRNRNGELIVVGINSMETPTNIIQLANMVMDSRTAKTTSAYVRIGQYGAWYVNILRELSRTDEEIKIEPVNPEDFKFLDDAPAVDDPKVFGDPIKKKN